MAITLRGQNANNAIDGAPDDLTITLPVGTATDDVVYVAYAFSGASDVNMAMITADYAELADLYVLDTLDTNLGVFRKVQGATPDTEAVCDSFGGTANAIAGTVTVLIGVDTTTPEDATTTTDTNTSNPTPSPPAIDTTTAGAWVLIAGGSTEPDVPTAPTNYVNLIEDQGIDSNPINVMLATREITSPGTETPGVFGDIVGTGSDSSAAATVAVRPAAGGGGITGAGALAAQASALDGAGTGKSTGTGALAAEAAQLDGAGFVGAITGTGDLAAQDAAMAGAGLSFSIGTGALGAQTATLDGAGAGGSSGAGDLAAGDAALDGVAIGSSRGAGALAAAAAQIDGSGTVGDGITGTGALAAAAAQLDGAGTVSGGAAARARRFIANVGTFMNP